MQRKQEQDEKFPWMGLAATLLMIAAMVMHVEPSMGGQRPSFVTMLGMVLALVIYLLLDFKKVKGLQLAVSILAMVGFLLGGTASLMDGHYLRGAVEVGAVISGILYELGEARRKKRTGATV